MSSVSHISNILKLNSGYNSRVTRSMTGKMESKAQLLLSDLENGVKSIRIIATTTAKFGDNIPITYNQILNDNYKAFQNSVDELKQILSEPTVTIKSDELFALKSEYDTIYFQLLASITQPHPVEVKPVLTSQNQHHLNLPRLTIKHFNGDFLQWNNFKALFESVVHACANYTDAQKLQILRSHLEGNALSLIDTLPINDANYTVSYKILCDKYDNIRSSANYHYSRVADIQPSDNLHETIKQVSSVARSSFNAFKSLKIDLADFLFFKLIYRALPANICADFDKECALDAVPSVEQLLTFLNRLEKSHETARYDSKYDSACHIDNSLSSPSKTKTKSDEQKPKTGFTRKSTALLLEQQAFNASKAHQNPKSHNTYCVICQSEAHNAYSCNDFLLLDVNGRYKQLAALNLCFNCLGRHKQSQCKSTKKCKICHSSRHNTLLHNYEQTASANVGLVTSSSSGSLTHQHNASMASGSALHHALSDSLLQQPHYISSPQSVFHCQPASLPHSPVSNNSSLHVVRSTTSSVTPPHLYPASSTASNSSFAQPLANSTAYPAVTQTFSTTAPESKSTDTYNNLSCKIGNKSVILATAIVDVINHRNQRVKLRAVLDSGSEATIITQKAIVQLGLPVYESSNQIIGISSANAQVRGQVDLNIQSPIDTEFQLKCTALVVPTIVGPLPSACLPHDLIHRFQELQLADTNFIHSSPVDLLLGADVYSDVVIPSHDSFIKGTPSAIKTVFGYIIFGKISNSVPVPNQPLSLLCTLDSINNSLRKFWEIEEVKLPNIQHPDDDLCENIFSTSTTRDEGRYVVALPFKPHSVPLTDNSKIVLRNYNRFEKRLSLQPDTEVQYHEFMRGYINLKHMELALVHSNYIIPHHCVLKSSSSTTKLRTVFNASHCDSNGNSLNSQLLPGPKLQKDICSILISFRLHAIVICADIKMMYRQILVRPEDRRHQHIYYRDSPDQDPHEFELNTVTYGLTPSAYLAQRVLLQLTEDEGSEFPSASVAIRNHSYVDDILTGSSTITGAQELIHDLITLFSRGGFTLRKWSSNNPDLLKQFPDDHLENPKSFDDDSATIKILGLQWNPKSDSFCYRITSFDSPVTKRNLLSYISKMFDPMGFLAPVVLWAKIFIQKLWTIKLGWDDDLPTQFANSWLLFADQLKVLTQISLPRYTGSAVDSAQLVGFCDASEKGYAAVFYLRTESQGRIAVTLLKSKTRVAPVKTLTIPRLELCAALLLAHLYESIADSLASVPNLQVHLYSDSQIVLAWLRIPAYRLKIFVSNRIRQILDLTTASMWHHIPSHLNPADIASRGSTPQDLIHQPLWWHGPDFLRQSIHTWNESHHIADSIPEEMLELRVEQPVLLTQKVVNYFIEVITKFSSYNRLIRVIAYVLRFINRTRHKVTSLDSSSLTTSELIWSGITCARLVQQHHFPREYELSQSGQPIQSVALKSLTPFFCTSTKTLRAGGRIRNSSISTSARHPIILPKNSHLSTILCRHYHESALHAGPRTTQALIQQEFWVIGIRSKLRWIIHNCVKCIRYQSKPIAPLMADLPGHRVSPAPVFNTVGLDFAGPFSLKTTVIRNAKTVKSYLCVFVCTVTKAAHLECVSDLTTEAFLAAFDRFVSRRGLPSKVLSDNGTNFVGAAASFDEIQNFLTKSQPQIQDFCHSRRITWVFNPPSAPNFGGLWEAAVKSAKFHLHRVLNNRSLTFEEFSTLLSRIEAVLNSRPLFEPSPDPNESHLMLTPGHFLIGRPLLQPPELEVDSRTSLKSRWLMLRHLFQNFWRVWSKHYLHTIIQRNKWHKMPPNLAVDQIVIIYGLDTPPATWPLARITNIHPSSDGIVRVVTLSTAEGSYVRPVNKLIPLPPHPTNC